MPLVFLSGYADIWLLFGTAQRQFHIERCDLHKLHSKKAIGILAEIWREVPMAVVSGIPQSFAEESKLRDILAQCGAVDAVRAALRCVFPITHDAAHSLQDSRFNCINT